MTHYYSEMNPGDALYIAARQYPGGIDALAVRMGMSAATLYKKLSTKVDTHFISYEEAQTIIWYLDEIGKKDAADMAMNSFCWQFSRAVVELPNQFVPDDKLFDQVLEIMQHKGDLSKNLRDSMRDGRISIKEYEALDRDIQTCILGLLKLRKKIHVKHVEGE